MRLGFAVVTMLAVAFGLAGCTATEIFACSDDTQCVDGAGSGQCEADGYCSVVDDGCESGRRYGDGAGGGHAGECVPGAGSSSASSSGSGSTTNSGGSSTAGSGGVTSASTTAVGTTAATSGGTTGGSTGPLPTTTGTPPPTGPYRPCIEDTDCPVVGSICLSSVEGGRICAPSCDGISPCPIPEIGGTAQCVDIGPEVCVIVCSTDADCPNVASMACQSVKDEGDDICVWFVPE